MSKKTWLQKVSLKQWIAVGASSISIIFLLAFGGQIVEIYRLRSALAIADKGIERLKAEQTALVATRDHVQSDEYAEQVARAELNKVRQGDKRVIIVTRPAPATPMPTPVPRQPAGSSHLHSWLDLLFGN